MDRRSVTSWIYPVEPFLFVDVLANEQLHAADYTGLNLFNWCPKPEAPCGGGEEGIDSHMGEKGLQ